MGRRERRLGVVQRRLWQAQRVRDAWPLLLPATLAAARDLAAMLRDDDGDLQARDLLGWLHWHRFQALPEDRNVTDLYTAIDMFTPIFVAGLTDWPAPLAQGLAYRAATTASGLLDQAFGSGDGRAASAAVLLWQRIVDATPASGQGRAEMLSKLGVALRLRYDSQRAPADLDAAIKAARQAVDITPTQEPDRAKYLYFLGSALQARFANKGVWADLDAAIEAGREAVAMTPADGLLRTEMLTSLGKARQAWSALTRERVDPAAGERGERVAAARARLRRIDTAQDPSSALEPAALVEANDLARLLDGDAADAGDLEVRYLLGWLAWHRHRALPEQQAQQDLSTAISMFTECFFPGFPDPLPEPLLPVLADLKAPSTWTLLDMLLDSFGDPVLLFTAHQWQYIVAATPGDHPDWAERISRLDELGTSLKARFDQLGESADLDAAIGILDQAVSAVPTHHPGRPGMLGNLAVALGARFERFGRRADLDAVISADQQAASATAIDDPDHARMLSNLATALLARAGRTGNDADLRAAITTIEQALATCRADHPDRIGMVGNLGVVLQARFKRFGDWADLDAAIAALEHSVGATPEDHPDRAAHLNNLGNALHTRFGRSGDRAELDAAITALEHAVAATSDGQPDEAMYLSNLGAALDTRSTRFGDWADLDAAITALEHAVGATPEDHPDRAARLSNLGNALHARFRRFGDLADLDAAIAALEHAVGATPEDHPDRATYLNNLGNALYTRFGRSGTLADLDAAVKTHERALAATPADHPDRATVLNNLGIELRTRFERAGVPADRDAAVAILNQAVDAAPEDHPDRARALTSLGDALQTRFEGSGDRADLDAALKPLNLTVAAIPADRARRLDGVRKSVRTRFERSGTRTGPDTAIDAYRRALAAFRTDHPDRATTLNNLGYALQARFERMGAPADRDAAVSAFALAAAAESAAPSSRIRAAHAGARLAARSDPGRAAGMLEDAVLLLPVVTPRRLGRGDQLHALSELSGLAADAAAMALTDTALPGGEKAARALRLLEAGRAVLLSQALETRSDLTDLREQHPHLAARFIDLRDLLDQPSDSPAATGTSPIDPAPGAAPSTRPARDRRLPGDDLTALLAQIRGLDGFGSFGLAPTTGDLLAQGAHGPVVTFNVSAYRSDALLLTADGITSLRLPGLTRDALFEHAVAFHEALSAANDARRDTNRIEAQARLREVLGWLWDVAADPVLHALGLHQPPADRAAWPRVWWAPGGLLSLLPIHAAGHHTSPPDPRHRTVLDRVVSSYTPTVGALRHARHRAAATPADGDRALIVAMPTTPGLPGHGELRNVPRELALLQTRLPQSALLIEPGPSGAASGEVAADPPTRVPTKANVLAHLPGCAIAHFACHGYSDSADPSRSLLLLHDHQKDPLNVASLAPVALDHARLAYLSACSTAFTSATRLHDEAIHLTSAFQLAGFPHVIGTLWDVEDEQSLTIADAFYTFLRTPTGALDTNQAAYALHHAVRAARDDRPITPSLWAGHLHAGA
jgi:tetratricopeptide (TPR) repeat protein